MLRQHIISTRVRLLRKMSSSNATLNSPDSESTFDPEPQRQLTDYEERREQRLRRRRQRERDLHSSETTEARLAKHREQDRARRARAAQSSLEQPGTMNQGTQTESIPEREAYLADEYDFSDISNSKRAKVHAVITQISPIQTGKKSKRRYFEGQLSNRKTCVRVVAIVQAISPRCARCSYMYAMS